MSSLADQTTLFRSLVVNRYWSMVSFSILYLDFVLVAPTEIELFWKTLRPSAASTLYILNRIFSLFGHIPVILLFFGDYSNTRCHQLHSYHQYLEIVTQGIVGVLLVMRTYALYNRSRLILAFLVILCIVGGSVGLWALLTSPGSDPVSQFEFPGCDLSSSPQQARRLAIAWSTMLIFDTGIFALTFWTAVQMGRTWRGGTLGIMLRDGTLYFGVLILVNIGNILSFIYSEPVDKGWTTTLTNILSSTLTARLMLNLRDPKLRFMIGGSGADLTWSAGATISRTIRFNHPVGHDNDDIATTEFGDTHVHDASTEPNNDGMDHVA